MPFAPVLDTVTPTSSRDAGGEGSASDVKDESRVYGAQSLFEPTDSATAVTANYSGAKTAAVSVRPLPGGGSATYLGFLAGRASRGPSSRSDAPLSCCMLSGKYFVQRITNAIIMPSGA